MRLPWKEGGCMQPVLRRRRTSMGWMRNGLGLSELLQAGRKKLKKILKKGLHFF